MTFNFNNCSIVFVKFPILALEYEFTERREGDNRSLELLFYCFCFLVGWLVVGQRLFLLDS